MEEKVEKRGRRKEGDPEPAFSEAISDAVIAKDWYKSEVKSE